MSAKIQWDMEWVRAHKDNCGLLSDFYRDYVKANGATGPYKSFIRMCAREGIKTTVERAEYEYDYDWIANNFDLYDGYKALHKAYEEQCGVINYQTFVRHLTRRGYSKSKAFTQEELDWIYENYPKYGMAETERLFHEKFGDKHTWQSISRIAQRAGKFVPREDIARRCGDSQRFAIGTTVIDARGNTLVKYGKSNREWMPYHRYLWEQEHGKIENGKLIIFLDGDKTNFSLDNLACVPKHYPTNLGHMHMLSNEADVTKAGIVWYQLYELLKEKNIEMEVI